MLMKRLNLKKPLKKPKECKKSLFADESTSGEEVDMCDDDSVMAASFDCVVSEQEKDTCNMDELKVSQWVVVQYTFKRSKKHYVGQIVDKETCDWKVKFTRHTGGAFYWPEKEDTDIIDSNDIIMVLPEPTINNRGIIRFGGLSFDGLNIQ
jgi:hypothetical protein